MRLLLDTHILLALLDREPLSPDISKALAAPDAMIVCSVASLWEIAIKVRTGKLIVPVDLAAVSAAFHAMAIGILPIQEAHVLAELAPLPPTRDPLDRLLLAQCQIEGYRLVTLDRALADHPLAWRGR